MLTILRIGLALSFAIEWSYREPYKKCVIDGVYVCVCVCASQSLSQFVAICPIKPHIHTRTYTTHSYHTQLIRTYTTKDTLCPLLYSSLYILHIEYTRYRSCCCPIRNVKPFCMCTGTFCFSFPPPVPTADATHRLSVSVGIAGVELVR